MHKLVALIVLSFALISCTQKYALDAYQPPQQRIPSSSAIYVMTPPDGRYAGITYAESGRRTAQALAASLSAITNKVDVGPATESLDAALAAAKANGDGYVFQPLILNWEDRATEWSGRPDRITIKVIVYDVASGKDIASVLARASSKWATFGGDHPQDLLPRVMNEFTARVF